MVRSALPIVAPATVIRFAQSEDFRIVLDRFLESRELKGVTINSNFELPDVLSNHLNPFPPVVPGFTTILDRLMLLVSESQHAWSQSSILSDNIKYVSQLVAVGSLSASQQQTPSPTPTLTTLASPTNKSNQ